MPGSLQIMGVTIHPGSIVDLTVTLDTGEKVHGQYDHFNEAENLLALRPKYGGRGDYHFIRLDHVIMITQTYS